MNLNKQQNESVTAGYENHEGFGGQAHNRSALEQTKTALAEKLRNVSDRLRQQSGRNDVHQDLSHFGQQTADWIGRSADYVQDINPQKIKNDVNQQVRSNPGRTLLIAGGIGLLLGSILRRR